MQMLTQTTLPETADATQRVARGGRVLLSAIGLLLFVETSRPESTCHTGRVSCFYRTVSLDNGAIRLTKTPTAGD